MKNKKSTEVGRCPTARDGTGQHGPVSMACLSKSKQKTGAAAGRRKSREAEKCCRMRPDETSRTNEEEQFFKLRGHRQALKQKSGLGRDRNCAKRSGKTQEGQKQTSISAEADNRSRTQADKSAEAEKRSRKRSEKLFKKVRSREDETQQTRSAQSEKERSRSVATS